MKCIKVQVKPHRNGHLVEVGSYHQVFSNYRTAKKNAEEISVELTGYLVSLNNLYMDFLAHYRRCWLLEAPFADQIEKSLLTYELEFNRSCSLPSPGRSMQNIIDLMQEQLQLMSSFFRFRNHHAINMEIKSLLSQLSEIETKTRIFLKRKETFLFLK